MTAGDNPRQRDLLKRLRAAFPAAPAYLHSRVSVHDGAQTRHGTIAGATWVPPRLAPVERPKLLVTYDGDEEPTKIHPLHGVTYLMERR